MTRNTRSRHRTTPAPCYLLAKLHNESHQANRGGQQGRSGSAPEEAGRVKERQQAEAGGEGASDGGRGPIQGRAAWFHRSGGEFWVVDPDSLPGFVSPIHQNLARVCASCCPDVLMDEKTAALRALQLAFFDVCHPMGARLRETIDRPLTPGRQQGVVDVLLEHPSISRKHAILQHGQNGEGTSWSALFSRPSFWFPDVCRYKCSGGTLFYITSSWAR